MNPRLPYSARALIQEIKEIDGDATIEPDNLDGLGTFRTIIVETSDLLGVAEAVARVSEIDPRISNVEMSDGVESFFVDFPTGREVESHALFGIKMIYDALGSGDDEPEKKPAKKTTAKKAAKKSAG